MGRNKMARSGIKVHADLRDVHKKFIATNKKEKPAYYYIQVGKRFSKPHATLPRGPNVKQDTNSEQHVKNAIEKLGPSDNVFIMFRVFFKYDDNGTERHSDVVLLVYWRSTAGSVSTNKERMKYTTSIS